MKPLKSAIIRNTSLFLAATAVAASAGYNFFNPSIWDSIPKLISGTGMYEDILAKKISPDIVPFEVNSPLWTDGAAKDRYIAVPAGQSVIFSDTADIYKYPNGTMVIKNFSVDTIAGDPRSRILFETRFTGMRRLGSTDKWYLWTYRWRLDQTDADLVPAAGQSATVRVYQNGLAAPPFMKKWHFPSVQQCGACHRVQHAQGRVVLAFFTAQLNRPYSANPSINQLQHFFDLGLLKTATGGPAPSFAAAPKWARLEDTTASLDLRARSYLGSNCSGCHGDRGMMSGAPLTTTIDYDYHDMRERMDLTQKKLIGVFPIDSSGLVVPGKPERSVILYRQIMRNEKPDDFALERMAMPPLGSYEPDTTAVRVFTAWINSLAPAGIDRAILAHSGGGKVVAGNGKITLPTGWMQGESGSLSLVDLKGRAVPLMRMDERTYRIEGKTAPGTHLLLWNGRPAGKLLF